MAETTTRETIADLLDKKAMFSGLARLISNVDKAQKRANVLRWRATHLPSRQSVGLSESLEKIDAMLIEALLAACQAQSLYDESTRSYATEAARGDCARVAG